MLTITGTLLLSLASILVRHYPNNVPRHPKCPLTTIPDRQNENRRRAPAAARPTSTRSAGAGGSSNTMLKLYTDSGEAGLKVCVF